MIFYYSTLLEIMYRTKTKTMPDLCLLLLISKLSYGRCIRYFFVLLITNNLNNSLTKSSVE